MQKNMENTIKAEYSLSNVEDCLSMWLDCSGTSQTHLQTKAIKWMALKLRENGEFTTPDREEFLNKFYLQMKNK
jgi:hypothetical protein